MILRRGHSVVAVPLLALAALTPASARADLDGIALNGRYSVVSDGAYAMTNEVFRDEAVVNSTWTIQSTCTTYQDCTGLVTSDRGWTADLKLTALTWRATRILEGWERCPDGTTAPGTQSFTFWAPRGDDYYPRALDGWDTTTGPSGACGINRSLVVRMPLHLNKIE